MPSRNPWGYQNRKRLRHTNLFGEIPGFDTGEFLVRKYPLGLTIDKLMASEGQGDAPNRATMVQWRTPEET